MIKVCLCINVAYVKTKKSIIEQAKSKVHTYLHVCELFGDQIVNRGVWTEENEKRVADGVRGTKTRDGKKGVYNNVKGGERGSTACSDALFKSVNPPRRAHSSVRCFVMPVVIIKDPEHIVDTTSATPHYGVKPFIAEYRQWECGYVIGNAGKEFSARIVRKHGNTVRIFVENFQSKEKWKKILPSSLILSAVIYKYVEM